MKFRDEIPGSESKSFLRLKDGESAAGVFRGDPYEFFVLWENKQATVVQEGTPGAKFRFRINFIIKMPNGAYEARILEQGSTVYKDLKAIHKEYNLEQTAVKITRQGSTMNDTHYSLMPLRAPVTEEVGKVKLLGLIQTKPPKSEPAKEAIWEPDDNFGPTPPSDSADDLPF
jgi:hypothetical protein